MLKLCTIPGCDCKARNIGNGRYGKLCDKHHRLKYPRSQQSMMLRKHKQSRRKLKKYSISIDDYRGMWQQQSGRCAICNVYTSELVIDHNHKSGVVRGLLCHSCNVAIGLFRDDIDVLSNAIVYLKADESGVKHG
jgi:hypothetical protein